ncbi:hypothetical protein U0070_010328 [Myodes glareolus]|uniref:Uncharacterized protein n=1 Tax=Myodes glareolus TaxID=447135 RepID=A0AAW0HXG3_MYOGA
MHSTRPTNSAGTPDCQSVVSPVLGSTVKSSEGRLCHLHPLYGFLAHSLTHKDRPYPTYLPPGRDSQHEVCHHLPLHSCAGSTKTVQHSENEKARPQAGVGILERKVVADSECSNQKSVGETLMEMFCKAVSSSTAYKIKPKRSNMASVTGSHCLSHHVPCDHLLPCLCTLQPPSFSLFSEHITHQVPPRHAGIQRVFEDAHPGFGKLSNFLSFCITNKVMVEGHKGPQVNDLLAGGLEQQEREASPYFATLLVTSDVLSSLQTMHHVSPVRLQTFDESKGEQRVHYRDCHVLVQRKHLVDPLRRDCIEHNAGLEVTLGVSPSG